MRKRVACTDAQAVGGHDGGHGVASFYRACLARETGLRSSRAIQIGRRIESVSRGRIGWSFGLEKSFGGPSTGK
jgi:hypothetical protein